jgi:hypothetical protein
MSVTGARELAVRKHDEQRDFDGSLHIHHVARVAEAAPPDEACQRVAWLHDVIEDSDVTAENLRPHLAADEFQALLLLTHDDPDESYEHYVQRIIDEPGPAGNIARAVKEADLLDNLSRCARNHIPRVARYAGALSALWSSRATS